MPDSRYEILTLGDKHLLRLNDPYDGVVAALGCIKLVEDTENDVLHLEFDCVLGEDQKFLLEDAVFKNYMGSIVEDLIREGLYKRDIVYAGGTDE